MKEKIQFKDKFVKRYEQLTDFESFKTCSLTYLRRSIRVNTLKRTIKEVKESMEQEWNLKQVPWCKEGFFIDHKGEGEKKRRDVGNTIEHQLGYMYIQEAVSMIPPIVLEPKPGETILDMCASPGSKTTQIAQYMQNKGLLIANDYKGMRLAPLALNLQRMGVTNAIISLMQGQWFKNFEFDRILVDAPCSGTGAIRKSFKTLKIWNPNMIRRLANTQKSLIETAFNNLKEGGTMVYSTCSCEPEEDEGVIDYLINKYDNAKLKKIKLDIKAGKPIEEFEGTTYSSEVKKVLRLWPQDNDTEGFFIAKIIKE